MKYDDILVSVIVPVYNVEKYLKRAVDSIRRQTHRNLEIILVDDGSTDSSSVLCDQLAKEDERITVIHKQNQGLGMARNSGIEAARGEWLCFIDSDDFIASRYVEFLLSAAVENGCLTAQCKYQKGIRGYIEESLDEPEVQVFDWRKYMFYCHANLGHSVFAVWINIYHRSIFSDIRFPALKHTEDVPAVSQIIRKASSKPLAVVNHALYYWYQRPDSIMNKKTSLDILDQCEAYERVLSFWNAENKPDIAEIYWPVYFEVLIEEYTRLSRDLPEAHDKYKYLYDKILNNLEKANRICHKSLMLPVNASAIYNALKEKRQPFILYGYGNNGRSVLPWLTYFQFPIIEVWDRDAESGAEAKGFPLKPAHDGIDKDAIILITIEDFATSAAVRRNLRQMGYKNFIEWRTLEAAMKYAVYDRFLPSLIKGGSDQ